MSKDIKKANEIVSFVKDARMECFGHMEENIDFLGCSQHYVEEKINALIFALKDLNRQCKAVDKRQNKNN